MTVDFPIRSGVFAAELTPVDAATSKKLGIKRSIEVREQKEDDPRQWREQCHNKKRERKSPVKREKENLKGCRKKKQTRAKRVPTNGKKSERINKETKKKSCNRHQLVELE